MALLKTNLSTTVTSSEDRSLDAGSDPFSAPLTDPAAFATLLWEASIVTPGGFYLAYPVNGGLPDYIFDPDGRATLSLVCLPGSQATRQTSGGALIACNNCVVLGDNLDAGAFHLYARETTPNAATIRMACYPQGTIGFSFLRIPSGSLEDSLFSILGVEQYPGLSFFPTTPPDPADESSWLYQATFDITRTDRPEAISQNCPWLPPASSDPYASLGATSSLGLTAMDVFGNTVAGPTQSSSARAFQTCTQAVQYTDRLIGFNEWPGTTTGYTVQASGAGPQLTLSIALQPGNYLAGPELPAEDATQAAATAARQFASIYYQIVRSGIGFTVASTLNHATATSPWTLSFVGPLNFVSSAYVFTSQAASLAPVTEAPSMGATLASFAAQYLVTPLEVLLANQQRPATEVIGGPCTLPEFDAFQTGETLNAFATRTGASSAVTLLDYAFNQQISIRAATLLNTADQTLTSTGDTLAAMAAVAQCGPNDIAAANDSLTGFIADGNTFWVRGVEFNTTNSTFASLVDDCAAQGVITNPAELGLLCANIPGFIDSGVVYTVRNLIVLEDTPLANVLAVLGVTTTTFASLNGDVSGLFTGGVSLQTGSFTASPSSDLTLLRWIGSVLQFSLVDFAIQVSGAPLNTASSLTVSALIKLDALTAVPYSVGSGKSLTSVAALFNQSAQALGTYNQDVPGIFVPGAVLSSGSITITTTSDSSIASLLAGKSNEPGYYELLEFMGDLALQPGALLLCPPPTVPQNCTTTAALAAAFNVTEADLIAVNQNIYGLLDPAGSAIVSETNITAGEYGTLANWAARAIVAGADPSSPPTPALLAGARFLLPPQKFSEDITLPAALDLNATITQLNTTFTITRPAQDVHPDFVAVPGVASTTAIVSPLSTNEPVSYLDFAQSLESAFSNQCRVAAGSCASTAGRQQLYLVRFQNPSSSSQTCAIRNVTLGTTPTFFAIAPLTNQLVSRQVDVIPYASGVADPLSGTSVALLFQAVDVETWGQHRPLRHRPPALTRLRPLHLRPLAGRGRLPVVHPDRRRQSWPRQDHLRTGHDHRRHLRRRRRQRAEGRRRRPQGQPRRRLLHQRRNPASRHGQCQLQHCRRRLRRPRRPPLHSPGPGRSL